MRFFDSVPVVVWNTILAGNSGGDCLFSPDDVAGGFDLGKDASCSFSGPSVFTSTDPGLQGLRGDGVIPLAAGSPAIGAARSAGVSRRPIRSRQPRKGACDVGAFESGAQTAPAVITAPADGTILHTTSFAVSGTAAAGETVALSIDGTPSGGQDVGRDGTWSFKVDGVAGGAHTISVVADLSGVDAAPAVVHVTVDASPPSASIDAGTTDTGTATFTFSGQPGVAFECSLGGAFAPCASPMTYGDLAPGDYTFSVRGSDDRGTGPVISRAFTVAPAVSAATPTPTPSPAPTPSPSPAPTPVPGKTVVAAPVQRDGAGAAAGDAYVRAR